MDLNEKRNKIIHEVLKEMLKRDKEQATFHTVSFIKRQYPECDSFECDRIIGVMKFERLIEKKESNSIWFTLTEPGKQIAESGGGWLGYVKNKNEKADKPPIIKVIYEIHWYDWGFRVATVFGILTTFYFSYRNDENGKKVLELEGKHSRQLSVSDSLSKEVLYRDTLLLREKSKLRKHVIDSLTNVLKLKK